MKNTQPLVIVFLGAILFCTAFDLPRHHPDLLPRKHTLRILSYNIHHASPPSKPGAIDLDAVARVINENKPDLVALQEVDSFTGRSGPFNQAEELGKKTGMAAHFFKAIDYDGGEYGLAILSRLPVIETDRYPLPRMDGNGGEPRILATATIALSAKEKILFACTHLDAMKDSINRMLQIKAIEGLLNHSPLPVVIAGDFNASVNTSVIAVLDSNFSRTCDPCEFTSPADQPRRTIDFIAYAPSKRFKVKQHQVIEERYASDHLPVMAELEVSF